MYTSIAKHIYFPALDRLKHLPFDKALLDSQRNQTITLDELLNMQFQKLRKIVAHAEQNTPYYRNEFRKAGVRASDLYSAADIRKFPLTDKSQLFENHENMRSAIFEGRLFKGTTSGSTGIATTFYYDSLHFAWVEASLWRGRQWWGVRRGDRQLVLWARPVEGSATVDFKTWAKYRLRNCVQFNTFEEFNEQKLDHIIRSLRTWCPALIYSYGSSLARLVGAMADRGITLPKRERPKLVQFTADHMSPQEREIGNKALKTPVTSQYGASECGGIAQECPAGGMHISVDHTFIEFLLPDGSPAEPGEVGEIVVTALHNYGMPLIRYRIGDLGAFLPGSCTCGLTLPLMRLTIGKAIDLISTSARKDVSAHVLDYINLYLMKNCIRGIKQFFVEQIAPDNFILTVVRETPFDERSVPTFIEKMKENLGESITVQSQFADFIAQEPTGKRRYFKRSFSDNVRGPKQTIP